VSRLDGVKVVRNEIEVLPASSFDDDLRVRISRAIYGNPNFSNYAAMRNPPIHIIVERGRVTLTGVVNSEVDRSMARALASQFGAFAVVSQLKTDKEIREELERVP
jgi:hyperosmotically inducible protein